MTDKRGLDIPVRLVFDFDEALERVAQTDPAEVLAVAKAPDSPRAMAAPEVATPVQAAREIKELKEISLRADLWKYALLAMVQKPGMEISTTDLIAELPKYIAVPESTTPDNQSRGDSKFTQIVRNLKSHKATKTNFIYQGYAEDIPGGFRATQKGRDFVLSYFGDCLA